MVPILATVALSVVLGHPVAEPASRLPSVVQAVGAALAADAASDRYDVHVVVMSPGKELFSRWGHIALRVDDRRSGYQRVYNYGTFDFRGPDDLWRYAKGFLTFRLAIAPWRLIRWRYTAENRDVWVHTLDLTPAQATEVARRLKINALPENRSYAYRHYLDNCTTRIRDLLDNVLGGVISARGREQQTGHSFRYWTRHYLIGTPVMRAAILFALGPVVDQPITRWHEQFLPDLLAEDLRATTVGPEGRPLVARTRHVVRRHGPLVRDMVSPVERVVIVLAVLLAALSLLLPLLLGARPLARRLHGLGLVLWGLVGGGGGLALAIFWGLTRHTDTWGNENLLVFLPTHLWLFFLGLKLLFTARLRQGILRALRWYLVGSLGLIALDMLLKLGPLVQDNWAYLVGATIVNVLLLVQVRSEQ